jgi:hypothetical protein
MTGSSITLNGLYPDQIVNGSCHLRGRLPGWKPSGAYFHLLRTKRRVVGSRLLQDLVPPLPSIRIKGTQQCRGTDCRRAVQAGIRADAVPQRRERLRAVTWAFRRWRSRPALATASIRLMNARMSKRAPACANSAWRFHYAGDG